MKNSVKILMLTLLSVLSVACNEGFLDAPTKSSMDESLIFSTPAYARNAIPGVIQSFAETNSYRGRYLPWYGINTDVEVVNIDGKKLTGAANFDDKDKLANYNTNVANDQMNTTSNGSPNNAYSMFYQGIERANLAIRGLRAYADMTNWELRQILGEILTLRAVLYTDLLKGWGNVPARFEPVNSETVYLPRVDRDVVLKQLLTDLEEAADLVGWPNENSYTVSTEHVNKCFVKALRARVALMAGGYSMHLGETTMRMSDDPDLEKNKMYTIARNECVDVITNGYARLIGFEATFKAVHDEKYVAGNENLWELPFAEGRGRVIFNLGVNHATTDKYTSQAKGGDNGPNPIMFYKYRKEDVRRDVSCIPYKWDGGKQVPNGLTRWYYGKYRYEWLNRLVTSTNDDGLNYLYMRYADVLLMAAEAINELEGGPANAAKYLKEIKDRAYPDNPEIVEAEMSVATAGKDAFFDAIVDERAKEFCGEMVRKADLIRWNMLTSKMAENRVDLQKLNDRESPYDDVPADVYYKTAADGESLIWYGLERGEFGAPLVDAASYSKKTWRLKGDNDIYAYWDVLYVRDPSLQPYWPVWQNVLDGSNGVLVNDPIFQ